MDLNVPIPNARYNTYPFVKLMPGESVLHICPDSERARTRSAAYRAANAKKWKIVVRSLENGIRVWRIS